jgi:hypothetical protein
MTHICGYALRRRRVEPALLHMDAVENGWMDVDVQIQPGAER